MQNQSDKQLELQQQKNKCVALLNKANKIKTMPSLDIIVPRDFANLETLKNRLDDKLLKLIPAINVQNELFRENVQYVQKLVEVEKELVLLYTEREAKLNGHETEFKQFLDNEEKSANIKISDMKTALDEEVKKLDGVTVSEAKEKVISCKVELKEAEEKFKLDNKTINKQHKALHFKNRLKNRKQHNQEIKNLKAAFNKNKSDIKNKINEAKNQLKMSKVQEKKLASLVQKNVKEFQEINAMHEKNGERILSDSEKAKEEVNEGYDAKMNSLLASVDKRDLQSLYFSRTELEKSNIEMGELIKNLKEKYALYAEANLIVPKIEDLQKEIKKDENTILPLFLKAVIAFFRKLFSKIIKYCSIKISKAYRYLSGNKDNQDAELKKENKEEKGVMLDLNAGWDDNENNEKDEKSVSHRNSMKIIRMVK